MHSPSTRNCSLILAGWRSALKLGSASGVGVFCLDVKDYYNILGVPEAASYEEVRKAFRCLALLHHPDRNPGNEKQAEEKFKEINEAFSVLGDESRRREYNSFRKSPFAHAGAGGSYSQEQVFRSSFSDPAFFADLDRMFRQAGLRFDPEFVNNVFGGKGFVFQFYTSPSAGAWAGPHTHQARPGTDIITRKPGLTERFIGWLTTSMLKRVFGIKMLPPQGKDLETKAVISRAEAEHGVEKEVSYKRSGSAKRLIVKIPPGIQNGTRIRLKGMGTEGQAPGDLYVKVRIRG